MKKSLLLLIPMLIILIVGLAARGGASTPGTATIAQKSVMNYETTGTNYTIDLNIKDAEDIQQWEANITFDPNVLEVVDAAEGEFLKSFAPGGLTFSGWEAPEGEGWVYIAASYYFIVAPGGGANGSGRLASITFNVTNHYKPPCPITLAYGPHTTLFYNNGTDLDVQPCTTRDGFFTIPGDFDFNGEVNFDDFIIFSGKYGSSEGDPPFVYYVDLDSSGSIVFDDFIIFSGKYGQSIPPAPP